MSIVIAILLILHGLITAAQSPTCFIPGSGVPNPAWLSRWPAALGQSWLLTGLGIERSPLARLGGWVWLAAGLLLVLAGLGALGWVVPVTLWRGLAVAGAVLSLGMLALYLHPYYLIGIAANIAILAAVWTTHSARLAQLGL